MLFIQSNSSQESSFPLWNETCCEPRLKNSLGISVSSISDYEVISSIYFLYDFIANLFEN